MIKILRAAFIISVALIAAVLMAQPAAAQTPTAPLTCSEPLPLAPGLYAYNRPGVFVRNLPTISGGQVNYYNRSFTLLVTEGPVCADGYNWWRVEGPGNHGWMAEGTPDFRLMFPADDLNLLDCPPPLALGAGVPARIVDGSRVREGTSLSARVIGTLPDDEIVTITGGVVCAENMNWWPVQVPFGDSGQLVDGWIAEGRNGALFLSMDTVEGPTPVPCMFPYRRLGPGIRAVVTYENFEPKNLRAAPGLNAPIVEQLLDGVAVDITGESQCADGLNWWPVTVVGRPEVTGWLAEGAPTQGYWLRPIEFFE